MTQRCPTCGQDVATPDGNGLLLVYTTVGTKRTYTLTDRQVDDWQHLYPALDVLAECRKAKGWLEANPTRRKTSAGMPKFLVNWLNRATDSPRRPNAPAKRIGPGDPGYYELIERLKAGA